MICFLCKHDILYSKQFGFREGFSSYMALLDFTNNIAEAFEKKMCTIGLFLDLSKAFDCVNHHILIQKMKHCGIRGTALDWLRVIYMTGCNMFQ